MLQNTCGKGSRITWTSERSSTIIIIRQKLTREEAEKNIALIAQWFKDNPRRKVCRTDLWKVRRGFVREDINNHSEVENEKSPALET